MPRIGLHREALGSSQQRRFKSRESGSALVGGAKRARRIFSAATSPKITRQKRRALHLPDVGRAPENWCAAFQFKDGSAQKLTMKIIPFCGLMPPLFAAGSGRPSFASKPNSPMITIGNYFQHGSFLVCVKPSKFGGAR